MSLNKENLRRAGFSEEQIIEFEESSNEDGIWVKDRLSLCTSLAEKDGFLIERCVIPGYEHIGEVFRHIMLHEVEDFISYPHMRPDIILTGLQRKKYGFSMEAHGQII